MSSVGSFFSYVNDARSHEPEVSGIHFNVCTPVPLEWSFLTNIFHTFLLLPCTLCPNHLKFCDLMMLLRTDDMNKYEASLYVIRVFALNSKLNSPIKQYNDSRNLREFVRPFPWFDLKKVTLWYDYVETEGRQRYSSNPCTTLERGEQSAPCSGCFIPGKEPVPIVQEAGWISGLVWTAWKSLPLPGLDPRTVQSIVKHHTNCTVPARDTASFCWNHVGYLSERCILVLQMPSQVLI